MKILQNINHYDVSTFLWLMERKSRPLLTRLSRLISKTGDGHLYLLSVIYLYWFDPTADGFFLEIFLLTFTVERTLYFILKKGFKRNRPAAALRDFNSFIIPSDHFSFPSGHTSAAFMVATLVTTFYPSLMFLLYFWTSLVGLSRIFLGVHFPTDVLMGALLGTSISIICLETVK